MVVTFDDVYEKKNMVQTQKDKGPFRVSSDGVTWKNQKDENVNISKDNLSGAEWTQGHSTCEVKLILSNNDTKIFGGFSKEDKDNLIKAFDQSLNIEVKKKDISVLGRNWGNLAFEGKSSLKFDSDGKTIFDVQLEDISQAVLQPKSKNELVIEMNNPNSSVFEDEDLTEIRFWVPTGQDDTAEPPVKKLHTQIVKRAGIDTTVSAKLLAFPNLNFLLPKLRFDVDVFPSFFRLHGTSYDYKIKFSSIVQLYKLPRVDTPHDVLLISLNPPVRQGGTTHPFLIITFQRGSEMEVAVKMEEKELTEKYKGQLSTRMQGDSVDVVAVVLKALSDKKIISSTPYNNGKNEHALRCAFKQNEGQLFPLEKRFVFLYKPVLIIEYQEISSVEFSRVQSSVAGNRNITTNNFDLVVSTSQGTNYNFNNIPRSDFDSLLEFLKAKKLNVRNIASQTVRDFIFSFFF
eukprot:c20195_g1_i2.p1 GENE.c20195_g1_i2~~c20195_g1_i2.p1  ORF type:complete len:477 (+),score=193.28 c20195_g1_i2:57-1433(+)